MDCIRPGPPEIRLNGVSQAGYWYQRHQHEANPGDVPSSDHTERKKYDEFTPVATLPGKLTETPVPGCMELLQGDEDVVCNTWCTKPFTHYDAHPSTIVQCKWRYNVQFLYDDMDMCSNVLKSCGSSPKSKRWILFSKSVNVPLPRLFDRDPKFGGHCPKFEASILNKNVPFLGGLEV